MMDETESLILFDCDGTLVDSHAAIVDAMQQAFTDSGLTAPSSAAVTEIIGLSLAEAVAQLAPDDEMHADIIALFRQRYTAGESTLKLYPKVKETLLDLRQRGYWLGIVTGKSRTGLLRVLQAFDLADLFFVLRTADCCPSKPHPAMVLESMQELGVSPSRTTVVGDAIVDIRMAANAQVEAVGVSFGFPMQAELIQAGARAVVNDFTSLLEHFPPLQDAGAGYTMSV